jgi:flagellar hook-basal body complex protein FliE
MAGIVNPAAISAYAQAAKMGSGAGGATGATAAGTASFGDILGGVMNDAIASGKMAEAKAASLVQGKGDLVDVVSAVNAAEMSLETVVAIRDKIIAAYQDILRMPI